MLPTTTSRRVLAQHLQPITREAARTLRCQVEPSCTEAATVLLREVLASGGAEVQTWPVLGCLSHAADVLMDTAALPFVTTR